MLLDRWGNEIEVQRLRRALGFRDTTLPADDGDEITGLAAKSIVGLPSLPDDDSSVNLPAVAI